MLFKGVLCSLVASGLCTSTMAWEYRSIEDPMGEQKIGFIRAEDGPPSLAFKCWSDGTILIIVGTNSPSNVTPKGLTLPMRAKIDGNREFNYPLRVDTSQMFAAGMLQADVKARSSDVLDFLNSIASAKSKIGVEFGTRVASQGIEGAKRAVQRFMTQCGFASLTAQPSASEQVAISNDDVINMRVVDFDRRYADGVQGDYLAKAAKLQNPKPELIARLRTCVLGVGKVNPSAKVSEAFQTCRANGD